VIKDIKNKSMTELCFFENANFNLIMKYSNNIVKKLLTEENKQINDEIQRRKDLYNKSIIE
jgi:hypothetical protein